MTIDNDYIADQFSLLAKIMDIHGENTFKTRSYSNAAFTIEKLPEQLTAIPPEKVTSIKGIGDAIGKKIHDIIATGELRLLQEYIAKTPPGIIEMLKIKGLGPKKIATVWKEMEVESLGELLYACQENRLLLYKGFGEKTQQNVKEAIEFYFSNQGSHLFSEIEAYAMGIHQTLQKHFRNAQFSFTGAFRRQLEIIDQLEWVTTADPATLAGLFAAAGFSTPEPNIYKGPENIPLIFIHTTPAAFAGTLLATSCSGEFLDAWQQSTSWTPSTPYPSEEAIFTEHKINFIPSYLREQRAILQQAATAPLPQYIRTEDIHAIIHSHSKWSDGSNTLEEMALACIAKGYEYLVISDHSKSAFYANGLQEDRIALQHQEIDQLNKKLAPFVIFKSVESDILNDGALDYSDNILSTFDLIIASVHSNLKMSEDKAMTRLLRAIENPYTTILGHMTGRLLLSRPGYPVDHKKIVDACVANQVVIELNAHPRRLDMDWRWFGYALEKGALISIDPDAHSTEGYNDVKYGVLAAQKGGLTPDRNLSSYTLPQFREFLRTRRR